MAYGGPNALEEIPGYLADIRSGRTTSLAVLDEITHNYRRIGGKSPLLDLTKQQIAAISRHFEPDSFKFYLGMRHWAPWIEETIRDMLNDGINQAVSIVMAPHYSKLSIAKYQEKIKEGLEMFRGQIKFVHIKSYHKAPGYLQALANRVREGLSYWPENERETVHVVFSAHSLPERILKMQDPYDTQLRETARLVAQKANLGFSQWSWSYQSAGRSPEPWLGPQIQEHLPKLASEGIKNVVSIPIGFVCDHVEILHDLDIQARKVAKEVGIRFERPPALNTDPLFIKALVDLIRERCTKMGWLNAGSI